MANTIKVTVVVKDGQDFISCPQVVHLPCPTGTQIDGLDYWINSDDLQQGWKYPATYTAPVAPAVGFQVARVTVGFHEYFVIGDTTGSPSVSINQQIADACNTCCGTTEPEVPAGTVPELNPIGQGQAFQNCDSPPTCTYTYTDNLPSDDASPPADYTITFICGVDTMTSTAVSTVAEALAYAQANWAAFGTWALGGTNGTILSVSGTDCSTGVLRHDFV